MDVEPMFAHLISTTVGTVLEGWELRLQVNTHGLQALVNTESVLQHVWKRLLTLVVILPRTLQMDLQDLTPPSVMRLPHLLNLNAKALAQTARSVSSTSVPGRLGSVMMTA